MSIPDFHRLWHSFTVVFRLLLTPMPRFVSTANFVKWKTFKHFVCIVCLPTSKASSFSIAIKRGMHECVYVVHSLRLGFLFVTRK